MASFIKKYPKSFALKSIGLVVIILVVTAFYEFAVRPAAESDFQAGKAISAESGQTPFSIWIVLKDYEQQVCFVLCFWALFLLALKIKDSIAENKSLEVDYLELGEEDRLKKEDARPVLWKLERGSEGNNQTLYYRVLYRTIEFFRFSTSLEEITNVVKNSCEGELLRLDSQMSMIRYIAWAIPSIGFLGTVRGIGQALGQAHKAVQGDIADVTQSLGIAFNSTFVALLISILIMFLMHQLQLTQERLVLDAEDYCDNRLIRNLQNQVQ